MESGSRRLKIRSRLSGKDWSTWPRASTTHFDPQHPQRRPMWCHIWLQPHQKTPERRGQDIDPEDPCTLQSLFLEQVSSYSLLSSIRKLNDCRTIYRLKHLKVLLIGFNSNPSPQPPTAAKETTVVPHLAPAPPKDPRTPRKGSRPRRSLHNAKPVGGARKFLFSIEFYIRPEQ